MPTYLTPGVYVEEMPSASKPIEGVGTSTAAFVGLAPGGPVNTPMRISNWSQFARIYGDPQTPANGPFMDGAYLAHAVYGFFLNGGSLCWIVRVGADGDKQVPIAALPAAADKGVEAFRILALEGVSDTVNVELIEEPTAAAEGGNEEKTYKLVISAGPDREEFDGLTLKKGRSNLATKVNASSKLVRIEETGTSLPEAQRIPAAGSYTLSVPPVKGRSMGANDFEGDVAERTGMGGFAAVDEVTMVVMPDLMALKRNGDDAGLRDVQGKMIAHCENMGDRMAILDTPPNLRAQDVLEWRTDVAGYDSKMAALYYPWIEVMDPLAHRPIMVPPSGHIAGVYSRTDSERGVHKAPANEVVRGALGLAFQVSQGEQDLLNPGGINASARSGRRHPHLGCPHAVERPVVALHQRAPSVHHGRVDHQPAPSGSCSSPTTSGSGCS